jgi:hypothetical protein
MFETGGTNPRELDGLWRSGGGIAPVPTGTVRAVRVLSES